jgi:hypothetical protein
VPRASRLQLGTHLSREAPIEDDRGTRTIGSKIDDSLIETKVA